MKNIAMIQNGVVQNVALWDGVTPWNPGPDYVLVDVTNQNVSVGDLYDGTNFTPPSGN